MAAQKDDKKQDFNKTAATGKKQKNSARLKKLAFGGGALFVLFIVGVIMFPRYGTINFGICKTFVELQEPYPSSINWLWAWDDGAGNVGIGYKRVDPFGLESSNEITCTIHVDEKQIITLEAVDINGKKRKYPQEDPEILKKFNTGLIGLFAYPPDLVLPSDWPADIKDYR